MMLPNSSKLQTIIKICEITATVVNTIVVIAKKVDK